MNHLLKTAPVLTRDQELHCIREYHDFQDPNSLGRVLHARMPWVWGCITNMGFPSWIDMESVFADVMGELAVSIPNYDPSVAQLSTYLGRIIPIAARKSACAQGTPNDHCTLDFDAVIDDDKGDVIDVLRAIRAIINSTPDDEINETTRLVIDRMLKGYSVRDVASQLGWSKGKTERFVEKTRDYIAWKMVRAGASASPWIPDHELTSMHDRYETYVKSLWL